MKSIKEISLLTNRYAMLLPPEKTYKHLLRFSKNWASGKRYNDFSPDEETWSYQTKNDEYVEKFEDLCWICNEFIRLKGDNAILMTDNGEYCLRITYDDNTHVNFKRTGNMRDNEMDEIAKQMLKMIPQNEFIPDSIKDGNTLENNIFWLCDYLMDEDLSVTILESMMAEYHLINRDSDCFKNIDDKLINAMKAEDIEKMNFLSLLNVISFVVSQSTMKLASDFRDKGLFKAASKKLLDFAYEQNEHLKNEVRKQFLFNIFFDACSCSVVVGFNNRPAVDLNYSIGLISFVKGRYLERVDYKLDDWDQNTDFELIKRLWNERKITIVEGLKIDGDYHIAITIGGDEYEE